MDHEGNVVKVLHVASFQGNLGDSAMHDGAYRTRAEDCSVEFIYTPLEVREFFHWGRRYFDEEFIDYLNTFDLAIFGGLGGYQLWRADTATGTCFDFSPELLKRIERPVAFYGLGCDASRGVDEAAMLKFRHFIDVAYQKNFLLSLRNDGSQKILNQAVGVKYIEPMRVIADGGLFCRIRPSGNTNFFPGESLIAVNLAGDMPDCRFDISGKCLSTQDEFVQGIADVASGLLSRGATVRLVFVPHIYSDMGIISKVLEKMPDECRRKQVSVAPYVNGSPGWHEVFDIYQKADLVIGMRFHSCVVPLGQGTPVIGIATHHKVNGLFEDMQLLDDCISLTPGWQARLMECAERVLNRREQVNKVAVQRLSQRRKELRDFHRDFSSWYANWSN